MHRLSLVAESESYSLVAVCGLLITAASPVAEHRPEVQRLHGGSTQPQQLRHMGSAVVALGFSTQAQ